MKNFDNVETVDKSKHAHLRVKPNPTMEHVKDQNMVAITLREFGPAACNYPIMLIKNPENDKFRPVVMMGFRGGENYFYGEEKWSSTYAPLMALRHPFIIGFDDRKPEDSTDVTICLEKDSPWLSETEGEPLFNENGEESDLLKARAQLLGEIFEGEKQTEAFTTAIVELGLVKPMELILQNENQQPRRVTGMYTIDEKKLLELPDDKVLEMHRNGYLSGCHLILASLFQLHHMVRLLNEKGGEKVVNYRIELNPPPEQAAATA